MGLCSGGFVEGLLGRFSKPTGVQFSWRGTLFQIWTIVGSVATPRDNLNLAVQIGPDMAGLLLC